MTSLEEAIRGLLVALAAGDLPLSLVGNLLSCVEEPDGRERQAAGSEMIRQLLEERDRQLLEVVGAARGSVSLIDRVSQHLAADRAQRQPMSAISRPLNLSEGTRSLLRHLREQRLESHRDEACQLLDRLSKVTQEREDLDRSMAATPDEADIGAVVDRFKSTPQSSAGLNQQAAQIDAAVAAEREKIEGNRSSESGAAVAMSSF